MPDVRKSMRKREGKRTAQASFSGKLPPRKPKNIDMRQREYLTKNQGQARTNPAPCLNTMGCEEARRGPSQWEHLTTACRRPPIASARASLRLSAAPEARR